MNTVFVSACFSFLVAPISDAPEKMGHALCICSRSAITIDNKKYYFIQKLEEG